MADLFDSASLVMVPSGYKAGKLYSIKPTDGTGYFTVARTSSASRINEDGLIEVMGANVPRINYPSCPSTLFEPERTNLVSYPVSFDNAYWTATGLTLTTAQSSPHADYPTDAVRLTATAVSGKLELTTPLTIASGSSYANALWMRRVTGSGTVFLSDINGVYIEVVLTTQWQRFDNVAVSGSTSGQIGVEVLVSGDEVDIFLAQSELGTYSTSDIYTGAEGSPVTREQDDFSLSGFQANSILGATEGTWFIDFSKVIVDVPSGLSLWITAATLNNSSIIFRTKLAGSNNIDIRNYDNTGAALWTSDEFDSTNAKVAIRWNGTAFSVFLNGTKYDYTGQANAYDEIDVRLDRLSILYNQMTMFATALTDAECIDLTT